SASVSISIVAAPPLSLTAGANATGNEGATTTFSLGSFSGGVGPYTVTVTWGDGTTSNFSASPGAISASHKYVNDGSYTITVTVTDSAGAATSATVAISVTRTGKGLFQPAGSTSNLVLLPFKAAAVVKTKHVARAAVARKAKHHAAKKSVRPATLSAQLI